MDNKHRADCIERGIRIYWHTLGTARDMQLHTGDIEWVMGNPRGDGPERAFNVRFAPDTARQRVAEVAQAIKAGDVPNGILLTKHSTPANAADLFAEAGFAIDGSGMCMVADLAGLPTSQPVAPQVRVALVDNPEMLRQWVDVINTGFAGEPIMAYGQFEDVYCRDYVRMYLGYFDGEPSSVAMTMRDGDTATVELVATLVTYRRRGLAAAVITEALKQLHEDGVRIATLRGESKALNLYRSLGFEDCYPRLIASLSK